MQCSLSSINSYPFENLLGKLKKLLRHGNNPLAQLCCRLNEMELSLCPKPVSGKKIDISSEYKDDNETVIIERIKMNNILYTTKSPNNIVLLKNNEVFQILKIFRLSTDDINGIKISGKILKKEKAIFTYPSNSEDLQMWVINTKNEKENIYKMSHIIKKMVCIDASCSINDKLSVIPLLHM